MGAHGGLYNPRDWDGGFSELLVDRVSVKGSKWPTDGMHYSYLREALMDKEG